MYKCINGLAPANLAQCVRDSKMPRYYGTPSQSSGNGEIAFSTFTVSFPIHVLVIRFSSFVTVNSSISEFAKCVR